MHGQQNAKKNKYKCRLHTVHKWPTTCASLVGGWTGKPERREALHMHHRVFSIHFKNVHI